MVALTRTIQAWNVLAAAASVHDTLPLLLRAAASAMLTCTTSCEFANATINSVCADERVILYRVLTCKSS